MEKLGLKEVNKLPKVIQLHNERARLDNKNCCLKDYALSSYPFLRLENC